MATTTELTGRRAWLLIDLDVQGQIFRYTDAPQVQTVTDGAGESFAYTPGMGHVTVERRGDSVASTMSITIRAAPQVSWAKMGARGQTLDRAGAIVRRWYTGSVLDTAAVIIRGVVTGPVWGNSTEPLSFTVERMRRGAGVIPTDSMMISATTWPVTSTYTTADDALGSWYPMVYGSPGQAAGGATTPAYLVEFKAAGLADSKLLIAGHKVAAGNVTLHDVKGAQSASTPVLTMVDLLGRTVSYVDFNTVTFAPEIDREYRIAWDQGTAGTPQGYLEAGAGLDGAGDIVAHLLRTWTDIDINAGRFAAAASTLNAYRLAFCIPAQVSVWDWVDGAILDLLPMEWRESASGEYPALWALAAAGGAELGHIDCTRVTGRYSREGLIESVGSPVTNRFTLQYAVGGAQGRAQKSVTLGSGYDLLGVYDVADGTIPSTRCATSERVYGRRAAAAVVTEIIDDPATALLIVEMWALLHALPRRLITVSGDLSLDRYAVGDIVTVTATDCEITSERAVVRAARLDGDIARLDLVLLDSPLDRTKAIT